MSRFLLCAAILIFGSLLWLSQINITLLTSAQTSYSRLHKTEIPMAASFEFPREIVDSVKAASDDEQRIPKQPGAILTSHHLPVAAGLIGRAYGQLMPYTHSIDTIVVIGPDHFEHCNYDISFSDTMYKTNYGFIEPSQYISQLAESVSNAGIDNDCFLPEHTFGVQAHYMSYVFGHNAKVVPITISAGTNKQALDSLVKELNSILDDQTLIIGSVDFSHYETADIARATDDITWSRIQQHDTLHLTEQYADSPGALYVLGELSKLHGWSAHLLEKANSYDILGEFSNTTGYMNIAYY